MTGPLIAAILSVTGPDFSHKQAAPIAHVIEVEAAKRNVDPYLVVALIAAESSFDASAVNPRTQAAGLMQIAPTHYKRRGLAKALLLAWNIGTGVRLLAEYAGKCGGDWGQALGLYHGVGACVADVWSARVMGEAARLRFRFAVKVAT